MKNDVYQIGSGW